jgi:hypothetical protein
VYTPGQILLATLIGAPAAGAFLLSWNFKRFGEPRRAQLSPILGVGVTAFVIAMSVIGIARPGVNVWSVVPAALCYQIARSMQGAKVRAHVALGGAKAPWWKALGTGVLCLLGIVAVSLLLSLLQR